MIDDLAYNGWVANVNQLTADDVRAYAGVALDSTNLLVINTWAALQFVVNGASSVIASNGSETSGDMGANNLSGYKFYWAGTPDGAYIGDSLETGVVFGALTGGQRASLNTNMHAAYGGF